MSLILEALKKSEAERHLGQTPDLLTPVIIPTSRRSWRGPGLLLAAVVVVLGLAAWWLLPLSPSDTATAPTLAQAPSEPTPTPVATPIEPPPPRPVTQPASRPVARTASDTIANVPVPQDPDFVGVERESLPMPAAAIPLTEAPPAPLPRPRADTPRPVVPVATTNTPSAPPTPASPPIATTPQEPVLESLPLLAHLLPSEREGLPPLRVSMHVYAAEPGARVVLIDGRRYHQGETIAKDLVIDEIRPDGVALKYRDRRFLLARP